MRVCRLFASSKQTAPKQPIPCADLSPCAANDTLRWLLKHLHTIMIIIDHVHIVLGIHRYRRRAVELAIAVARLAPDIQKCAARVELADSILRPIRDIYIALRVDGDPDRVVEVVIRAGACIPLSKKVSFQIELLNARVAPICDINCAFWIDSQSGGVVKLPIGGAAL